MPSLNVDAKLKERGWTLPAAPKPIAAYVPSVQAGSLLHVSGQLPLADGELIATGKVPAHVKVNEAQEAARQCVLNALAVVKQALDGDWSRLVRVVRLGVYVQAVDSFTEHAEVANGASELLVELLGEAGRHARAAVGVASLPLNAPVELEMTVEVRQA